MDFLFHPIPMAATASCLLLTSFLLYCYYICTRRSEGNQANYKKKYHPVGGTIFHQFLNFRRLHHYMTDLAREHKTYRLVSLLRNQIYTADPINVEYILKTKFNNYGKGVYNQSILRDLFGNGIFMVDGDKWREQRKLSSFAFSTRQLRDFSSVVFRKNAAKLAMIVSEAATSKRTIDIQEIFTRSAMDTIFSVAFGVELESLKHSSEESSKLSNAFEDSNELTIGRYVDVLWRVKKVLNIGSEAALKKSIKIVDDFVYKTIRNKTEQMHKPNDHASLRKQDLLSRFVQLEGIDEKYLRDMIVSFIIAGKDTLATSLSWFIYMLCKHPSVQEKISQEMKEMTHFTVAEAAAAATVDEDINITNFAENLLREDVLEKMHYLHAAITETLRLYPPIPVDVKTCFSDDTFPDGFSVRKGDMVAYQPYAMGRMTFIWGDDAQDFRPERWLDENGCFRPQSSFRFTAFQAGPRICMGKEFAYRQMKIMSAVLLVSFVFQLSDETKAVNYKTMISLHIDGGLLVRVFRR